MEPENTNPNLNREPLAPQQATPVEKHEGGVGPAVATLIILAVIILGGVYFWSQRGNEPRETDETSQIEAQSTSDAISDIEADLNNTDLESLDDELNGIN